MDGMNPYQPNNPHQPNNPYHHNPYQPQGYTGGQTVYAYNPYGPGKGSSRKIIIGITCAFVVIIAMAIGVLAYHMNTPMYKITKGLHNLTKEIAQNSDPLADKLGVEDIAQMMQEDGGHVQTMLNFTVDIPSEEKITVGVDTNYYKDMSAKELSADTSISIRNYEFAHLNIYANDEVFCFSIPELFLEDLYIENENIVSQYNNSIFGEAFPIDTEERSINLFPDEDERISLKDWKSLSKRFRKLQDSIDACRGAMTVEKAGKGLYRVTFPEKETNRLIKNLLQSIYEDDEVLEYLIPGIYKKLIASDVRLLFEINGKNRIESIVLEHPVEMLDGGASIEGEILFLGEKRSIDLVQSKLSINGLDGETREILGQIQQTSDTEASQMDMDLKYLEGGKTLGMMKYVMNSDAVQDKYDIKCSWKNDRDSYDIIIQCAFDDIVKGESLEVNLKKIAFVVNDEEYFKINGDIGIEPLRHGVQPGVKPKKAFFEMTYFDWLEILYRIEQQGNLSDSIWDFIW